MPRDGKAAFGRLFRKSLTLKVRHGSDLQFPWARSVGHHHLLLVLLMLLQVSPLLLLSAAAAIERPNAGVVGRCCVVLLLGQLPSLLLPVPACYCAFWCSPLPGCQRAAQPCRQPTSPFLTTTQAVAVVQRAMRNVDPCLEMQQLGFGPLLLIKSFSVNMSGWCKAEVFIREGE